MGRICAVPNCHAHKRELGLREVTVFSIPKKNNALASWSKAIGKCLSMKDGICELHFSEVNIAAESRTVIADGTIHVTPHKKKRLVRNAIPDCLLKIKVESEDPETRAENLAYESDNSLPSKPEPMTSFIDISKNFSETAQAIDPNSDANKKVYDTSACVDPIGISIQSKKSHKEGPRDLGTIFVKENNAADSTEFGIADVMKNLKNRLPENWWWMTNPKEDQSIVFIRMNPVTFKATLRLIVYSDLSVTVFAVDNRVISQNNSPIASFEFLEMLLHETESKVVCSGIGIKGETYHQNCLGFADQKKFTEAPRCQFCRHRRKILLNAASRRKFMEAKRAILFDEVALSEAVNLVRKTFKFNGFVDLGKPTPLDPENTRPDLSTGVNIALTEYHQYSPQEALTIHDARRSLAFFSNLYYN